MINVSDEIKQAYDNSTTQVDKIVLNGAEYRIKNVEYYDDVYNEGNIFGTAIAKGLDFEIENTVNLEGQEFEYLTGIKFNGAIQWISLGNFIVQSVESNDTTNINKVSAMDYMLKTNIPYETALDYASGAVTLLQVLREVCNTSGLTLATTNFANSNFIVDSNQFEEGTLNRQVIQAVAQVSGTVAKIRNNQLYLLGPSTTVSKVFTLNNYKEAEIKRATHPINVVSLRLTDIEGENITLRDEESISKNGENVLAINDNPFAYTQDKREQLITALFNVVKGFEYKAYTFDCQGLPYLETMDKIQFKDKKGNTYDSYVFRFNYKSPNGLDSTIEAPSIISATVNYQNVPSALDVAKRTEYRVNKQEGKIIQLVSSVEEIEKELILTATTEEGREHYLPDSADNNCKSVKIFGESTQDTRSGKNLLQNGGASITSYGITTTVNGDGSVTVEGTATQDYYYFLFSEQPTLKAGTYILSGCPSGGSSTTYRLAVMDSSYSLNLAVDDGSSGTFTLAEDTIISPLILIRSGVTINATFYPMIRLSTVTDGTYEPYGAMPSPEFPSEIENVRGKNLLQNNATSTTINGITFTVNSDGTVIAKGTATSNAVLDIGRNLENTFKAGDYIASGCPSGGSSSSYQITVFKAVGATGTTIGADIGTGATFKLTEDSKLWLRLVVYAGKTVSDLVFKPMISTTPTFYVPYNHIGFKSTGKNLLNIPNVYELYQYITNTSLSLPAGEYVLSAENIVTDTTNEVKDVLFVFKFVDGTDKYVYLSPTKTSTAVTFDKVVVSYNIYANYNYVTSIGVTATFTNLMLRRSADDDTYEPYKESITTIPLLHDMRSLPNGTRDRIHNSNSKWYDEQRVNERIIKTNEGIWEGVSVRENTTRFYIRQLLMDMPQTTSNNNIICSHFPANLEIYNNDEIGIYLNYANASYRSIYISVPNSLGTTLEEIKAWFDANEVKIQYELAEPIITEITDEATIEALESIRTFKGITNITADAPSVLTYYRDVPMVDEYETKQNANKTYKAIKSQFADLTIEQNKIKSTVSETITKVDEQGNKIGEVETSLNQVTQTAEETKSEVSKKVGNDEIISKINQSAEEVQIDANKISLKRKNVRFNI